MPLLHIDDSEDGRLLVRQAIKSTNAAFTLYTADGADSAAPFFEFRKSNPSADSQPRPAVILLDYDLGLHTGADFLIWLRVVRKMTAIPVIMYSGSVGMEHVGECYEAGANHFVRKPLRFQGVQAVIRTLNTCMSFSPPRFGLLANVPEYVADPRGLQAASSAQFAIPSACW